HRVGLEMAGKLGRGPHMIEPAAAVVLRPVRRTIAPPGEAAFWRGDEMAADVDPLMRLLQPAQRVDLDGRVADNLEQRLVAPDVAFQRRNIEVANDDRRLVEPLRPARHALDEVELLAELGIDGAVR